LYIFNDKFAQQIPERQNEVTATSCGLSLARLLWTNLLKMELMSLIYET